MMLLTQLACVAAALGAAVALPADTTTATTATAPLIHLDYATYQGSRAAGAVVDQFLGMRFAKPPMGDLRFRAPQEPAHEDQVQDATKVRHVYHATQQTILRTKRSEGWLKGRPASFC